MTLLTTIGLWFALYGCVMGFVRGLFHVAAGESSDHRIVGLVLFLVCGWAVFVTMFGS